MKNFPVQDFLEVYIKKIVKYPESVSVAISEGKRTDYILCIQVAEEDVGKVIGKDGKMVSALKNVISACKAKDNISYELVVASQSHTTKN
ncbi:KH domain-containing protein [Helicobacter didelphidarum]|uniref:KH domain-containing protein n=1 Tax=Helicobacter didelphidarum TaxID=2040648 RepID=A0A3D8IIG0_9HELI|nr:KH domain-containing protein [Helicobacter didelphidarum]RDU64903.1 KH domain-containing protein [Helicobacter didelphidarum]